MEQESLTRSSSFLSRINHFLSSDRYYVIERRGRYQGKAITNSKKEEKTTRLCCPVVHDVKPSSLDPLNIYQQVVIIKERQGFHANSVARKGIPPKLLREKGWRVSASTSRGYCLDEALGVNSELRARLPDFDFPLSDDHSESMIVGKWYCTFMFVNI